MDTLEAYQSTMCNTMLFGAINFERVELSMEVVPLLTGIGRRRQVVCREEGELCLHTIEELCGAHARSNQRVSIAKQMERLLFKERIVVVGDPGRDLLLPLKVEVEQRGLLGGGGAYGAQRGHAPGGGVEGALKIAPERAKQGEEAKVRGRGEVVFEVFAHEGVDMQRAVRLASPGSQVLEHAVRARHDL